MEPRPDAPNCSGGMPPMPAPSADSAERERAARVANLVAYLEAERKARGLRRWADWKPR